MKNQIREHELYTVIGQSLVQSLADRSIRKWDKVILIVSHTHGVTKFSADCLYQGVETSISSGPIDGSVIDKLKEFTDVNNYTPWNKFKFELFANYKFNIEYEWDQDLIDEHEKTQS